MVSRETMRVQFAEEARNGRVPGRRSRRFQGVSGLALIVQSFYNMGSQRSSLASAFTAGIQPRCQAARRESLMRNYGSTVRPP